MKLEELSPLPQLAPLLNLLTLSIRPESEATTAQIQAESLEQLEPLADALLDFHGPADLTAWLAGRHRLSRGPIPLD